MKYLFLLLLLPFTTSAEMFDYSHKWGTFENYRLQAKFQAKNKFFVDLEVENSFYTKNSDIRLDIRRVGGSYGFKFEPLTVFAGGAYVIQDSIEVNKFEWAEAFIDINYRVKNYPVSLDLKYTVPFEHTKSRINAESKVNEVSLGIAYELYSGLFLRIEKHSGGAYYIGFRKWLN